MHCPECHDSGWTETVVRDWTPVGECYGFDSSYVIEEPCGRCAKEEAATGWNPDAA